MTHDERAKEGERHVRALPSAGGRTDVAFVMAAYAMGGMELQLAALLRHRPGWARDLSVEVITFLPAASAEVEAAFGRLGASSTLIDRSRLGFPEFMLRLTRHLRRTRPRLVHTQLDASAGTWGRMAALLSGVPGIVQSDLSLMVGGTPIQRRLRRFLDARTQLFLPNANAIRDRLVAVGVRPERIQVLMPGVDLTRFSYDRAEQRPMAPEGLVAGFLGRFDPVKRIDVLLDALVSLPEASRPWRLLLAGDGPTRPDVERRIAAHPWLSDHCRLLGRQEDVPAYLGRIDYLVHPSEVEGLPNAVLEAMAMGRPIVATRVSDVPLVVGDAGFMAEPADVGSLAAAIARMQALGQDERLRLGERARRAVEQNHDIVEVSERFWRAHARLVPAWGVADP